MATLDTATPTTVPSLLALYWTERKHKSECEYLCQRPGQLYFLFKSSNWLLESADLPVSSFVTSIYDGSVLAVGMCGCQSLEGLVRYFVSVTTHFSRGQPVREKKASMKSSEMIQIKTHSTFYSLKVTWYVFYRTI